MTLVSWLVACGTTADDDDMTTTPVEDHTGTAPDLHTGRHSTVPETDSAAAWVDVPLDTGQPGFGLAINEVLADVGGGTINDANCDGAYGLEDQFLELVNTGTVPIDLADCTIERGGLTYRRFPRDSVLEPGHTVLLFSGGTPDFDAAPTGTEPWCTELASTVSLDRFDRALALPECGPISLFLYGPVGFTLGTFEVDEGACTGQSLVRSPELDADAPVVPHGTVSPGAPGGQSASPGTRADGSAL
jgi:Lamin Tail Domain